VSDVTQYNKFLPFCQASPVHSKKFYKDQLGRELFLLEADLKVGFLKFSETYTSTVTCYPNHLVRVIKLI
jgi:ribosome-associated toxin RatA of RatAB toxin-antitoxin module